jgi:uroporphyrinogen decarboxylase
MSSTAETSTGRQRVLDALAHRLPQRVPFAWGFGPTAEMGAVLQKELAERGVSWAKLRDDVTDIMVAYARYVGPALPAGTDEWRIKRGFISHGAGAYYEIEHYPLAGLATVADIEVFPWPRPEDFDTSRMRQEIETSDPRRAKAWRVLGGNPFEIYCWMRGLEESLTDLVMNEQFVHAAMERITSIYEKRLEAVAVACGELVDLVFFADDLGGQQGLLLSREMYREFIQPYHRRLIGVMRRTMPQAKALYHSDGSVFDVLPDLIDAGIDCLEAVQVETAKMEPWRLKQAFGKRISFHGGISVQQLLPHGTANEVASICRELVTTLGDGGGYIAAPSHAIQVGTPVPNVVAMLEAVLGPGVFAQAMDRARI